MPSHKWTTILFLLLLVVPGTMLMALPAQEKSSNKTRSAVVLRRREQSGQLPTEREVGEQMPIADVSAPEPTDPEQRAKRQKKSKRYDHQSSAPIEDTPYASGRVWSSHWARGLSAIPLAQSDSVVIGEIADEHAYLSHDKTGVYSEFAVHVQEILMDDRSNPISFGDVLTFERFGGAVRFPSGHIQRYTSSAQGMPHAGRTYVLFLKRIDADGSCQLVTGFELRGDRVIPVDGTNAGGGERLPFDDYKDARTSDFLRILKDTIAKTILDFGRSSQ